MEPLTLDNFRKELDEQVLERGWHYFQCGWVKPPREVMPGYFEFVVAEVNPHAVSFSREGELFTDVFCTCDDRQHEVCRHFAAALFYLEAEDEKNTVPRNWDALEQERLRTQHPKKKQ